MTRYARQQRIETDYDIRKSTQYYWEKHGLWPKRVHIGPRAVGWPVHEIEAVMDARATGADDAAIRKLISEMTEARHTRAGSTE